MKLAPIVLVAALCTGCASFNLPFRGPRAVRTPTNEAEAASALQLADEDFQAGRVALALERAVAAREADGLPPERRNQIEAAVATYADARIDDLSRKQDPEALEEFVELNLPRQLAVRAGVIAAEQWLAEDEPYEAYKLLKRIDSKFPNHHERERAGQLLVQAGLELADSDWSFLGFFEERDDGMEVLEYLVIHHPKERRCDEAYSKLSQLYSEDREHALARERCEDLLLYHPDSPLTTWAEARVPRMRLRGLKSPEYDRTELVQARRELERWLERHAGATTDPPQLEEQVRLDLADCLTRMAISDIGVARFYRRIDRPDGVRLHAERALADAKLANDDRLASDASSLLAEVAAAGEQR